MVQQKLMNTDNKSVGTANVALTILPLCCGHRRKHWKTGTKIIDNDSAGLKLVIRINTFLLAHL